MKSIICIFILVLCVSFSVQQCNCNNKCCCNSNSGQFRLVPLYELYLNKTDTYYYTILLREINASIRKGYARKTVIGLLAVGSTDCKGKKSLIPVSRWYNDDDSDFLYQSKPDHDGNNSTYHDEGTVFYGAPNENQCGASRTLYRFCTGKRHILVTDVNEGKRRAGPNGKNEGSICRIWPVRTAATTTPSTTTTRTTTSTTPTPTTKTTTRPTVSGFPCQLNFAALLRLYRTSTDCHLYTTSADEANKAIKALDYNPEDSPGLVVTSPTDCPCSLKPVYRLYRPEPKEDNFYTTSDQEATNAVSTLGYSRQGIAYYCAVNQGGCGATLPFYRFQRNNTEQNHFYTIDLKEGTKLGGTNEGIMCYIWVD